MAAPTSTPTTSDVVVTGAGAITPAGRGVAATWQGVLAGKGAAALDPSHRDWIARLVAARDLLFHHPFRFLHHPPGVTRHARNFKPISS